MGFFSNIGKVFGFGNDEGRDAAEQIAIANQRAQTQIEEKFKETQAAFEPFITAGTEGLERFQQGATPQGLDEQLGQIFGGDLFQQLAGERRREVQGQLGAAGLTRSGTALQEVGRIPSDIGLQLSELLSGKNQFLSGQGFGATTGLENARLGVGSNISNLITNTGQARSSGILTDAQSQAAGTTNLLRGLSTGLTGFFGR